MKIWLQPYEKWFNNQLERMWKVRIVVEHTLKYSFIESFINGSTALLLGPDFFSFVIFFTQSVGLLG
jgi:hypothetical protein